MFNIQRLESTQGDHDDSNFCSNLEPEGDARIGTAVEGDDADDCEDDHDDAK